jgi:DNA polymerase-3 subunit chi
VTRVDFYVLSDAAPDARLRVACRLIEKAFEGGLRVYVQTSSLEEAQRLDELLWTFNDRAFIPHEVIEDGSPITHERTVILIGLGAPPSTHRQLLMNLTTALPVEIDSVERIAEIVDVDPENKRRSRERYKAYRELGCALESHNL